MNLNDVLQFYRPDDYKTYIEGKKIMQEEKEAKEAGKKGLAPSKPAEVSKTDTAALKQHQNITPEDLKDINDAFNQFRKVDPSNPADDGIMKVNDLGLAMRKVRFTPGPVELQEIQKDVDIKTEKLL